MPTIHSPSARNNFYLFIHFHFLCIVHSFYRKIITHSLCDFCLFSQRNSKCKSSLVFSSFIWNEALRMERKNEQTHTHTRKEYEKEPCKNRIYNFRMLGICVSKYVVTKGTNSSTKNENIYTHKHGFIFMETVTNHTQLSVNKSLSYFCNISTTRFSSHLQLLGFIECFVSYLSVLCRPHSRTTWRLTKIKYSMLFI